MKLTKQDLIGLIQYTSGEIDLIDVTEQDAESILKDYLETIDYAHSSLQLPSFDELNIEMKKLSEKLETDAKQTEKNYFEAGFNYCHHIIANSLNK